MRLRNVINGGIPSEDTAQAGGSAVSTAAGACEPGARRREAGGHVEAHRWAGLRRRRGHVAGHGEHVRSQGEGSQAARAQGCETLSERLWPLHVGSAGQGKEPGV